MIHWGEDVDDTLRQLLRRHGLDTVEGAMAFEGGQDLQKPNLKLRRRTRLTLVDSMGMPHVLYMKRYARPTMWTRLGELLRGRRKTPARLEFDNIQTVRRAGVPTMRAIVCGEECSWGFGASYVIMDSVPGEALERCGEAFFRSLSADPAAMAAFTGQLAAMVRAMHSHGLFHRDLYAAHVFADVHGNSADLSLIDLARVIQPCCLHFRWRVKDLAQLKYSMPESWTADQWNLFMSVYLGDGATNAACYNNAIDAKVAKMRRHDANRRARREGGKS